PLPPASAYAAPAATAVPRRRVRTRRPYGAGLSLAWVYMSVIVLIPLAAVAVKALAQSPGSFWASVSNAAVVKALIVTLGAAILVSLINVVTGTLVAWVLVRDEFPGKRFINALIDLPFALPTVVAGLTLIALYGPDSPFGVHLTFTRA